MDYGVMYNKGDTRVYQPVSSWEEAYNLAFTVGSGCHHPEVGIYAWDEASGLMVKVVSI